MKLTEKCKEDFKKFLISVFPEMGIKNTNWSKLVYKWFIIQNLSMQYGVYVDFFDSFDIEIEMQIDNFLDTGKWYRCNINGFDYYEKTRPEARIKAIEKANEIYNKSKHEKSKS